MESKEAKDIPETVVPVAPVSPKWYQKTSTGKIAAIVSWSALAVLLTVVLCLGVPRLSENGIVISPWYSTAAGAYSAEGKRLKGAASFTYEKKTTDSSAYYSLSSIAISSTSAVTLVLPYAHKGEGDTAYSYVLSTADADAASNLFSASPALTTIYQEHFYGYLGSYAFAHLPNLTSVAFGNSTQYTQKVAEGAFLEDPALVKVTLADTLLSLGQACFAKDIALTSLDFTKTSLAELGSLTGTNPLGVFEGCAGLTSLSLPSTLKTIGPRCFQGTGLTSLTYAGTSESWASLNFGDSWKNESLSSVVCSDKTIAL